MIAQELMIGNIVLYKGGPITITMIGEYGIQSTNLDRTINAKFNTPDLEGLPLSPDILERYGYFRQFDGYYTKIDSPDFEFYYKDGEMFLAHSTDPNSPKHKLKIKYVHQLQNLFFILSGEQLEGR